MGLPPQMDEEEKNELISPLPGCCIHNGDEGLLTYGKPMQREGWDFFNCLDRFPGITAIRLAHSLTCHCTPPPFHNVVPIWELAPSQPNAWTDGSLSGNRPCYAHGGYGIWHPDRYRTDVGTNELCFAHVVDVGSIHGSQGVALAGTLLEPFSSSTRNEIAAMLVAISASGPVHIGTDSLSAAKVANKLIDNGIMRRPFSLCHDGDLWMAFGEACKNKGRGTVAVSWTKGHTPLRSLLAGKVSIKAAVMNSIADAAADKGSLTASDRGREQLLLYYASKQKAVDKLYAAIHRRIARVAIRAAELRDQAAKAQAGAGDAKCQFIPTPPQPVHPQHNYTRITLVAPPPVQGDEIEQMLQHQLRIFWTSLHLVPVVEGQDDIITY